MIQDACTLEYIPLFKELIETIKELSEEWKGIPMLAKTHGQPASPTSLGKELRVFVERLEHQFNILTNNSSTSRSCNDFIAIERQY